MSGKNTGRSENYNMKKLSLLLQLIISLICLKEASAAPSLVKPDCADRCGDVPVPYPFGMGKDCFFNDSFSVHCDHSFTPPKPFLNHSTKLNLELLKVSLEYKTVTVNSPITPLCQDKGTWRSADLSGTPFTFSSVHNIFVVVGCDTTAVFISGKEKILAGCSSNCNMNSAAGGGCFGIECCQSIVRYDNEYWTHLGEYHVNYTKTSTEDCSYVLLGDSEYWFSNNISSKDSGYAPLVMFWEMEAISFGSCDLHHPDRSYETTIDRCLCPANSEGNPFLPHGCVGTVQFLFSETILKNSIFFLFFCNFDRPRYLFLCMFSGRSLWQNMQLE